MTRACTGTSQDPSHTIVNSSVSCSDRPSRCRKFLLRACFNLDTSSIHHGGEARLTVIASLKNSFPTIETTSSARLGTPLCSAKLLIITSLMVLCKNPFSTRSTLNSYSTKLNCLTRLRILHCSLQLATLLLKNFVLV